MEESDKNEELSMIYKKRFTKLGLFGLKER